MDVRLIDALVAQVFTFLEAFTEGHPTPDPAPVLPPHILDKANFTQEDVDRSHFADAGHYQDFPLLSANEQVLFAKVIGNWSRRREFPGSTREGMEKRLRRLVVDCLNEPDRSEELTRALISNLQAQPIVDVLLPISGIDLKVEEWRMSDDVSLVLMTPERFEREVVGGYVQASVREMPIVGSADVHGEAMANILRPGFIGASILRVRADGDEYQAQEAAETRADLAVDALQFAAAVFHSRQWRIVIDWTGDIPASGWRTTGQIPVQGDVRPNNPGSLRGMLAPWRVDSKQLEEVERLEVNRVIEAVMAREDSERNDMIRRAVRAFADGERQRSKDGQKLSYTTVFDIFFSVRETSDTARSIREGVAFTMFDPSSLEERFKQAQFINRIYESRSRTSHEFELGISDEDVAKLREIAYNFIGAMARRETFTKKSLRDEIDADRKALGDGYERFKSLSRQPEETPIEDSNDAT